MATAAETRSLGVASLSIGGADGQGSAWQGARQHPADSRPGREQEKQKEEEEQEADQEQEEEQQEEEQED